MSPLLEVTLLLFNVAQSLTCQADMQMLIYKTFTGLSAHLQIQLLPSQRWLLDAFENVSLNIFNIKFL